MDESVRMVVLAKSWKTGGYCVAGKRLDADRGWVRPVRTPSGGSLSNSHCLLDRGGVADVLSVVDIPLGARVSDGVQRENRLLGKGRWHYVAAWDRVRLGELVDEVEDVWLDPKLGACDRVRPAFAGAIDHSLLFLRVSELRLSASHEPHRVQPKLRAGFVYRGVAYQGLSVTSPRCCQRWRAESAWGAANEWAMGDAYVCLSLGQPFNGYHYKFVAEVYPA